MYRRALQLRPPPVRTETRVSVVSSFFSPVTINSESTDLNDSNYDRSGWCRAPEPQVLDYQAQQNKLFPPLAAVFGFNFCANFLWDLYNYANSNLEKGDLELLPEVSCYETSIECN